MERQQILLPPLAKTDDSTLPIEIYTTLPAYLLYLDPPSPLGSIRTESEETNR